jgi:hypothetical protein
MFRVSFVDDNHVFREASLADHSNPSGVQRPGRGCASTWVLPGFMGQIYPLPRFSGFLQVA